MPEQWLACSTAVYTVHQRTFCWCACTARRAFAKKLRFFCFASSTARVSLQFIAQNSDDAFSHVCISQTFFLVDFSLSLWVCTHTNARYETCTCSNACCVWMLSAITTNTAPCRQISTIQRIMSTCSVYTFKAYIQKCISKYFMSRRYMQTRE